MLDIIDDTSGNTMLTLKQDLARLFERRRGQPMAFYSKAGRIREANAAYLGLFGYSHAELFNAPHRRLVAPGAEHMQEHETLWRVLELGAPCCGEYRRISRTGEEFSVVESFLPLSGGVLGVAMPAGGAALAKTRGSRAHSGYELDGVAV